METATPIETGCFDRSPNALSLKTETGHPPGVYDLTHWNRPKKACGFIPTPDSNQPPVAARGISGLAPRAPLFRQMLST
jgi:hypothetical protein